MMFESNISALSSPKSALCFETASDLPYSIPAGRCISFVFSGVEPTVLGPLGWAALAGSVSRVFDSAEGAPVLYPLCWPLWREALY